jgi:hypothetical protein
MEKLCKGIIEGESGAGYWPKGDIRFMHRWNSIEMRWSTVGWCQFIFQITGKGCAWQEVPVSASQIVMWDLYVNVHKPVSSRVGVLVCGLIHSQSCYGADHYTITRHYTSSKKSWTAGNTEYTRKLKNRNALHYFSKIQ